MNVNKDNLFLNLKDYSVSKEDFSLQYDESLDMLITNPQPRVEDLSRYYESEDYISHTDAKRSIFEKMYHYVKNISLKSKLRLIDNWSNSKGKLLDIGAGTGDFLSVCKQNGWQTTGFEPSNKPKSIAEGKGITFTENLSALESNSFDVITMWHVLEHVPNLEYQIAELKRLLKEDGTLIIAVPNYKSYDANHYGKFWAAYDVPRHLWHFSKKSIAILFQKQNMELRKVLPMKFDSFYVSLLSEKYKTGKMNFVKAFFIGLLSNLKAKKSFEYSSHIYIIKNG